MPKVARMMGGAAGVMVISGPCSFGNRQSADGKIVTLRILPALSSPFKRTSLMDEALSGGDEGCNLARLLLYEERSGQDRARIMTGKG